MLTRIPIYWLWLLIFLGNHAVAATDCAVQTDIPQNQCQALLDLYNSTDGVNWFVSDMNLTDEIKNDWNVTNTPCSWVGVTCRGNSVAEIDLSMIWKYQLFKGLNGTLPDSLVNLTGLTYLNLSYNKLSGRIPTLPTGLISLNLSANQLTGTIPTLPAGLTSLNLYGNQLSGTIPSLPSGLNFLNLSDNQLTGTILTLPTGLVSLNLYDNQLGGTIPNLPSGLSFLNLSHNHLTGTIPFLPEGLTFLDLSYNQLAGTVPNSPVRLIYNNLQGNQHIEGTNCATQTDIPQSQCQALVDLYNSTGGANWSNMPNGWNMTNTPCNWAGVTCSGDTVTAITLPYYNLVGTLPNSLVNLTGLTHLDLHGNQLSGTIPTLPTRLTFLSLSSNQLTGTLPTLPTELTFLGLSDNQLTGTIPTLPAGLTSLNLSGNQLTGTVPTLPSGLSTIDLDNTSINIASSGVPIAPSNNGIASEPMSNYGQVANNLTVTETGSVSGGMLTGTITNKGLMANVMIAPQAIFSGGKLSGFNINQGTVGDVKISQYAEIAGGNYTGIIHNAGLIFNPAILENAVVGGGQLAGTVFNQGMVHDVYFAAWTQVVGGKLMGMLTGHPDHNVIIGEAELDAAKISNACLTVTVQMSQTVELTNTIQHTTTDFTQLTPEDFCIEPQSIAHFTAQRLAATEKLAFNSFTAQHVAELPIAALSALNATQLAQISSAALHGFSVEQFQAIPIATLAGLHKNNMEGLAPQVIRSLDQQQLQALTATEFQQMSSFGMAKWLTHLNHQLTVADITPLLPTGWKLSETGQITAPDNTAIALRSLEIAAIPQLELPNYQFDLNTTFSIGGQTTTQTIFDSIKTLLSATTSQLVQTEQGILTGELTASRSFAFMINPQGLWQRTPQASRIQLTENQPYQLMTMEHLEVNLSPVPKKPVEMLKILGEHAQAVIGAQGDVFLSWGQEYSLRHLVALFNPFSDSISATKPPGLYFSGKQAQFIYSDGTAQTLYPTVFDPDSFIAEAKKFPGVEAVQFNMDGTFEVTYQGQKLQLFPDFDVEVMALEKYQHVKPSVKLKGNGVEYQVQHGQQLLTSQLSFTQ